MILAYVPKYFKLEEFLPKEIFSKLMPETMWKGYMMLDERMLRHADHCREAFGPLTINNWSTGGSRNESGLRVPGMKNYSQYSQHSFGRAFDCVSSTKTGEQMRQFILANKKDFPYVTRMEIGTSWLHSDCGNAEPITMVNA
jgi:hypothetical protein